jgi:hypothetical protein
VLRWYSKKDFIIPEKGEKFEEASEMTEGICFVVSAASLSRPNTGRGDNDNLKNSVSWDIMLCSMMKANQSSGGTFSFHLQSQRVHQTRN